MSFLTLSPSIAPHFKRRIRLLNSQLPNKKQTARIEPPAKDYYMYTQTKPQTAHVRPDLRLVAHKANRIALPVGFSRRELQRLVADMID